MTAHINVARSRSLRSAGVLYDVTIDGEAVGRLKRGQTISHEVKPGTHDVKALFAKTGWRVPVKGHWNLPRGGRETCPVTVTRTAR